MTEFKALLARFLDGDASVSAADVVAAQDGGSIMWYAIIDGMRLPLKLRKRRNGKHELHAGDCRNCNCCPILVSQAAQYTHIIFAE